MAIRLPNQDDIASVGPSRDPGIGSGADDFGAQVGRAQQRIGATIRNLGDMGVQLAKQRQEPEDRSFIDFADNEFSLKADQTLLDAETTAPAGGDGYADGVDANLTQLADGVIDRLIKEKGYRPSQKAIRAAKLLMDGKRTNARIVAQGFEHNARVTWLQSQYEETAETLIQQALASGDPMEALAKLDGSMAAYEGSIPAAKLEEVTEQYQERIVQAAVDGLHESKRIEEARALSEKFFGSLPRQPEQSGDAVDIVVNQIIQVESGGDPNARNPRSSAAGAGQFIDSTWLAMVRRHRPDIAAGKTAGQIIALKSNGPLSKEMTRAYAVENGEFLANRGIARTPGNLYLAHFLGPQGATLVLKADPGASIASIAGQDVVRANPFLKGKSASQVAAWADRKMGGAVSAGVPAGDPIMPNADAALKNHKAYETSRNQRNAETRAGIEIATANAPAAILNTGEYENPIPTPDQFIDAYGAMEGARRYNQFRTAMEVARQAYDFRTMPADAIKSAVEASRPSSSGDNAALETERYNVLITAAEQTLKTRDADPVVYVQQAFPHVKQAWSEAEDPEAYQTAARMSLVAQEQLGVPADGLRVLSGPMAAEIVRQFNDQKDGGQNAAFLMQSLQEQWGDLWPRVFSELAGELPAATMIVGTMNRPDQMRAAEELAEAAKLGAKAYTDNLPPDEVTDLRRKVIETTPEFAETMAGIAGGQETTNAVRESVELLALRYRSQGDSVSRAAARAYDDVVGKAWNFQDGYRVPKDVDARMVGFGAGEILSRVHNLNLDIPDNLSFLPDIDVRAAWLDVMVADGRWITRPDGGGLFLFRPDNAVATADGEPVTFTWDELAGFENLDVLNRSTQPDLDPASEDFLRRTRELDRRLAPMGGG